MEILYIDELPDSKERFDVLVHDWRRKQKLFRIKIIALILIIFSCSIPSAFYFLAPPAPTAAPITADAISADAPQAAAPAPTAAPTAAPITAEAISADAPQADAPQANVGKIIFIPFVAYEEKAMDVE